MEADTKHGQDETIGGREESAGDCRTKSAMGLLYNHEKVIVEASTRIHEYLESQEKSGECGLSGTNCR